MIGPFRYENSLQICMWSFFPLFSVSFIFLSLFLSLLLFVPLCLFSKISCIYYILTLALLILSFIVYLFIQKIFFAHLKKKQTYLLNVCSPQLQISYCGALTYEQICMFVFFVFLFALLISLRFESFNDSLLLMTMRFSKNITAKSNILFFFIDSKNFNYTPVFFFFCVSDKHITLNNIYEYEIFV